MATEQQTRPAPSAKFEAYVEQQLGKVKQRLRAIDLGAAALLLLAITLGYAALMAVFDLIVRGSSEWWVGNVRLIAFGLYMLAMAGGGYLFVTRFLRRINPYYCARQLEQTLPDAKNSVINWLDLREERLPPAIRSSLGQKAAQDLKEADADQVANPKPTWFMGSIVAGLFVVLVILFAVSPQQFASLLARAFLPFRDIRMANRATITLIKPNGDVEVPHNQRVEFVAEITGRFPKVNHPQAPTLWRRYGPSDPFVPMALEEDGNGQWSKTLAADQIQNGFWYKITAADAETPVYQVSTRSLPEAKQFEVTYHYRPYRKLADEVVVFPNEVAQFPELRGHRGTEVQLVVRTNQAVRDGWLEFKFDDRETKVPGERVIDDPKAFRCKFGLQRTGQFSVMFKTTAEELNVDRSSAYRIDVLEDGPPAIVITKPSEDVSRAANGTLTVEGQAQDDFGVKTIDLRLRVVEGESKANLAPQRYRPNKQFQFDTGAYPTKIDYLDVLALDQIKTAEGQPFPLSPGMILEYWLEATDNSDFPSAAGNVGRSLAYKIKIETPKDQKKQEEERKQAQDQQKKHEKKQDQQHQKENQEKKDQEARNNSGNSADQQRTEDQRKDLEQQAKDIKVKLDQQEKKENQGSGKGGEPEKAENKSNDGQQPQANQKDSSTGKEPPKAGENKNDGGKNDGPKSAEAKGAGDQKQPNQKEQQQASEPKGPGNEKPQPTAKGSDGDNKAGAQPEQQPASAKAGPKDDPKQNPGEGKDQGQQGGMDKSAQSKDNGPKDDNKMNQGGQAKAAEGNKDAPAPQAKKIDKQEPKNQPGQKGDTKPGNGEQLTKEKGPGNAKPDATASKEPPGADGSRKPAEAKPGDEPTRKAEAKPGEGGGGTETKQGPPAQAKNQPMNPNAKNPNDGQQGAAKETPADQAKESARAKDEKGQGPPREPTMKDLERLKDQLAKGDPNALKTAEELKRNLPESKDPQMTKAAEELLQGAAKKLDEMAKKNSNADPNVAGGKEQPMGKANEPMTGQGGAENTANTQKVDGSQKAQPGDEKQKRVTRGGSGPDGQDVPDNSKPAEANKDFADRVANLQLEDLKSRATPEKRQLAGITDEEWQQFLKTAASYEQSRQKSDRQSKPDQLRATSSQWQGGGPRQVRSQPGGNDPASIGQPQAPPELREAQHKFTQKKQ
jgi:collagen type III alpha